MIVRSWKDKRFRRKTGISVANPAGSAEFSIQALPSAMSWSVDICTSHSKFCD